MIVKCRREMDHLEDLRETFITLRKYKLKLNPQKCVFGVVVGKFLGFLVDQREIEANPDKIQSILNMTSPSKIKEVQRLTGCLAALGRFLSKSGDKCHHFFATIKKNAKFEWMEEAEKALQQVKEHLRQLPRLISPAEGEKLYVCLVVSPFTVSVVLLAERESVQIPVYFVSHVLKDVEGRYSMVEKFGLALLMASRKLRSYFLTHSILVYTDQPLKQVLHKMDVSGRMLKWFVELNMFGLSFELRKAIKGQALADFIVELTRPAIEYVQDPAKGKRHWTLMVDGSSTANGCGDGIIFQSPEGDKFEYAMKFQFQASNNEAKYEALLANIKMCKAAGALEIEAKTDSLLVVSQVNGDFECKEASMSKYMNLIKEEIKILKRFVLDQVPRLENHQADALSKLASVAEGDEPRTVFWEIKPAKSIDQKEVLFLSRENVWMSPIIEYKKTGQLPIDPLEAKYVKARDKWFELWDGTFYKMAFNRPLLKCISREDGLEVLKELHEGACASHNRGRALGEKVLRTGYYWPTLKEDALLYAKKCNSCQRHGNIYQKPSNYLTRVLFPLPFAKWGMDILGPFHVAAGQKKFVIVSVDYFTKWVEAEAMRGINSNDVKGFVCKNLITRFGMPQSIVFDNGPQFETPKLREWLADQGIKAHFAAVAHPQANGQVEAFNKILSAGIKKKLDNAKGLWVKELELVLWSIRTTVKNSTGETQFMLVYGSEAVLPIEIEEPTLRVMPYSEDTNWAALRTALDQVPEVRDNALLRTQLYKLRMAREFNKRVARRPLKKGDLFLRKMEVVGRAKEMGKLTPNWEGPYKIVQEVQNGTFCLEQMDGRSVPRTWNSNTLKKYFV
ncbi:uncharacterized protein LOC104906710 [Beta vulgaris subsp. vulgaris]|uniref:uncharacterized protein LOC104906710 n=1 Tax=Beta vulgaris subsp. vulgaris TaxID=3555 RepID=UPI002037610E|nr:uncharacterized protein LOC104906710 [Beta vulgaris subsp. vulgaris]